MWAIRLLLILSTITIAANLFPQQRTSPLTSGEVEELIQNKLPDSRLAIEIRRLGIKPLLKKREAQRLKEIGAGPETQTALGLFILLSPLTIISDPPVEGLTVAVGDRTTLTNSQGQTILAGLVPGSYELVVEKAPAYLREAQWITLPEGGSQIHVTLHPAPGKLNVGLDNGTVEISSYGLLKAPIRELELPAGTYSVSVTVPKFLPYNSSVTIRQGETINLQPTLVPDMAVIDSKAQKIPDIPKSAVEEKKARKEVEKLEKQKKEEQKRNDRALSKATVSGCNNNDDVWVDLRVAGKPSFLASGTRVIIKVINKHSSAIDIWDMGGGAIVRNLCSGGSLIIFRLRNFLDRSTIQFQYYATGILPNGSLGRSRSQVITISGDRPLERNLTWEVRRLTPD